VTLRIISPLWSYSGQAPGEILVSSNARNRLLRSFACARDDAPRSRHLASFVLRPCSSFDLPQDDPEQGRRVRVVSLPFEGLRAVSWVERSNHVFARGIFFRFRKLNPNENSISDVGHRRALFLSHQGPARGQKISDGVARGFAALSPE